MTASPRLVRSILAAALSLGSAPMARAAEPAPSPPAMPAADARQSFAAYRALLARGAVPGDEALFTPESWIQRARRSRTRPQDLARLAELDSASPLRLQVVGDRAVLLPAAIDSKTAPVLLHRIDGFWRVDLVELSKNHRRDAKGEILFSNSEDPYAFAYPSLRSPWSDDLSPVDLSGEEVDAVLSRLDRSSSPAMRLRLAEILLRNVGAVDEALEHYEEAARLAPADWALASVFGERACLLGQPDRAIERVAMFDTRAFSLLHRLHTRAGRYEEGQHFARADLAERIKKWNAEAMARELERKKREQQGAPAAQSL